MAPIPGAASKGLDLIRLILTTQGGMNEEDKRILDSLYKAIDDPNGRQAGRTRCMIQERISIALRRYISHCLIYRRTDSQRNLHSLPWDSFLIDSPSGEFSPYASDYLRQVAPQRRSEAMDDRLALGRSFGRRSP